MICTMARAPFLKQFEPYPYGVDPHGFAYNYRKRAQLLFRLGHQKHAQLSDTVIDSRPALDLKKWGEAEWEQGRRCELRAGQNGARRAHRHGNADGRHGAVVRHEHDASAGSRSYWLREAVFSYNLAQRLWVASDAEYVSHLRRNKTNIQTYRSHRDELAAQVAIVAGDENYMAASLAPAGRAMR